MSIAGYARVSSREQSENSHALEQQIERLKRAGAQTIYCDVESGSKVERRELDRLLSDCAAGLVGGVIVTRLDRLGRNLPHLRKIIEQLRGWGTNFIALDDNLDLSTAAGKFQFNMLGALAEMETDRLSERVRHGWAHLRDRKVAMNPPFGYRKEGDCFVLDDRPFLCLTQTGEELSTADIARQIIQQFLQRQTLRATIRWLNEEFGLYTPSLGKGNNRIHLLRFSPAGLSAWLRNPALQGHTAYLKGKVLHRDTHPALLDASTARAIDEILTNNRQHYKQASNARYPLSGLVQCAACRASAHTVTGATNYHKAKRTGEAITYLAYFQCSNWRTRGCDQRVMVQHRKAQAIVDAALAARAEALADMASIPDEVQEPPELIALREELRLYESMPGNRATPIIENLRREIQQMEAALTGREAIDEELRAMLLEVFADPGYWESLSDSERRQIYVGLVRRIWIHAGEITQVDLRL